MVNKDLKIHHSIALELYGIVSYFNKDSKYGVMLPLDDMLKPGNMVDLIEVGPKVALAFQAIASLVVLSLAAPLPL